MLVQNPLLVSELILYEATWMATFIYRLFESGDGRMGLAFPIEIRGVSVEKSGIMIAKL